MEASVLEQPIALKTCYKCKMELPTGMFWKDKGRKDGLQPCCKACCALYREPHKEQKAARAKLYREDHKEEEAVSSKRYYKTHKEEKAAYSKVYNEANRKGLNARLKQRRLTDPQFKLAKNLRCRFRMALKGNFKAGSAVRDLGCSLEAFRLYLESHFQPGMTWENYGFYGWHLDHIRPLSSFDLTDREQFLIACHYTNYQPLWAKDNLSKGDRLDWEKAA